MFDTIIVHVNKFALLFYVMIITCTPPPSVACVASCPQDLEVLKFFFFFNIAIGAVDVSLLDTMSFK